LNTARGDDEPRTVTDPFTITDTTEFAMTDDNTVTTPPALTVVVTTGEAIPKSVRVPDVEIDAITADIAIANLVFTAVTETDA
jgi:hypothetical protein